MVYLKYKVWYNGWEGGNLFLVSLLNVYIFYKVK